MRLWPPPKALHEAKGFSLSLDSHRYHDIRRKPLALCATFLCGAYRNKRSRRFPSGNNKRVRAMRVEYDAESNDIALIVDAESRHNGRRNDPPSGRNFNSSLGDLYFFPRNSRTRFSTTHGNCAVPMCAEILLKSHAIL